MASNTMKKTLVLVTGGNSGVGFSLASILLADPTKHILLGCRSFEKGTSAIQALTSPNLPGTVELLHIDVSDEDSVTAAARVVGEKYGHLDVLVNNAAIGSVAKEGGDDDDDDDGSRRDTLTTRMLAAYQTNAIGPLLTVETFIPLLRKSTATPRIINVGSGAGSMAHTVNPAFPNMGLRGVPYSASKAAMNLITGQQIRDYGPEGVKVFVYSPGFVVSNLGPNNNREGGADPTELGAEPLVAIIDGKRDDEHGLFLRRKGTSPW